MILTSCRISIKLDSFFFKQKTAYEMRISDWSSDVCSSDLVYPTTLLTYHPTYPTYPLSVSNLAPPVKPCSLNHPSLNPSSILPAIEPYNSLRLRYLINPPSQMFFYILQIGRAHV